MRRAKLLVIPLFVALVLSMSLVRVKENEQVVLTQFGRPVGVPITTPGLHFKLPLVQRVQVFDASAREWRGQGELASRDRVLFDVEMTASWRIGDAVRFYESMYDVQRADALLDDELRSTARAVVAEHEAEALLSSAGGRDDALREIQQICGSRLRESGIELLDARFASLVRRP